MNKNFIVWTGIALAIIFSIVALVGDKSQPVQTIVEKQVVGGSTADNWDVGGNLSVTGTKLSVEGVMKYFSSSEMTTSTTTVCALQSPARISILKGATVNFTTSSTTASTISIARAATAYATTTILGSAVTLNANEAEAFYATTTNDIMFAPSTYLVVGMAKTAGSGQNSTMGLFSPVGYCQAEWQSVTGT